MDPSRRGTYTFALLTVSAISLSLLMYILGDTSLRPGHAPWLALAPTTLRLFAQNRNPNNPGAGQGTPLIEVVAPAQTTPLQEGPPTVTSPSAVTGPSTVTSPSPVSDSTEHAQAAQAGTEPFSSSSHPACLPNSTKLVSAEAVLGVSQVLAREARFLPAWAPREESYLVMECNFGRVHLLLAGLLNRTLIIDSAPQRTLRNDYDWSLLVHGPHLRACFGAAAVHPGNTTGRSLALTKSGDGSSSSVSGGEGGGGRAGDVDGSLLAGGESESGGRSGGAPVVLTSGEYQQLHGGERLQVDALVCWHTRCNVNWRRVNETMTPTDVSESIRATSFSDMVDKYSTLNGYRSIMAGDLFNAYKVVPRHFWNFGDLPFARKEGCPDALAMSPHPRIVASAKEWVQRQFGGEPFLGIHWRSRDFGGLRICLQEEFARACLAPERVARCVASVARDRGLKRVVICSDGTAGNMQALANHLSKLVDGDLDVVQNPVLDASGDETLLGPSHEGVATFQKVVLAHASVFLGTMLSTFSMDIERMRVGWGAWNCHDRFICEGTDIT